MQVIDLDNYTLSKVFALIYGASGSGKTHIIGTLARLGRVLMIDVDQGSDTIANAPDLDGKTDSLTAVSFNKFGDLDVAYKLIYANDPVKWSKALGIEVTEPFDWIVWDSWSELQWIMLEEIRRAEGLSGIGLAFRKNIQIQHWQSMTDLNKLAVEKLRECKVNQIFIMGEGMMKDELSGQIFGGPAIHGKMVQEMPGFFNVVVYTSTDALGNWVARTLSKGKWVAKTRLGVGAEYKNPTAYDLFTPDKVKKAKK